MFNFEPQFKSVRELLEQDAEAPLTDEEFDGELWQLLCQRTREPQDLHDLASAVGVYYASRFVQWEVGNGGFAQAALNIPQWFALAAAGYEELGKGKSAALIREAMRLLPSERLELEDKGLFGATVGPIFEHFSESQMAELDAQIDEEDWYVDADRVRYVRANRATFAAVE